MLIFAEMGGGLIFTIFLLSKNRIMEGGEFRQSGFSSQLF